jgi:ubiquinone/menaquinone biosynthesis C-methylase UbiE
MRTTLLELDGFANIALGTPLRHLVERPRRDLKPYVRPGMTALDVGCGDGHSTMAMARLAGTHGRIVAVDSQVDAIEALERRMVHSGLSGRIEPRLCSEPDLGLDDLASRVDFAISRYVIQHAADPAHLVMNVNRTLRPGAIFLVVEPGHHASVGECRATETATRQAGFTQTTYPRLWRDWGVIFTKDTPRSGDA